MAYTRWSKNSDLYIYHRTDNKLICTWCNLLPDEIIAEVEYDASVGHCSDLVEAHMKLHRANGDLVPDNWNPCG